MSKKFNDFIECFDGELLTDKTKALGKLTKYCTS